MMISGKIDGFKDVTKSTIKKTATAMTCAQEG
jgi:hypothetical protein